MCTERIYYSDSQAQAFDATVLDVSDVDGRPAARLDRTAFYPTSGGQPHDTGLLGGRRVLDVVDRDDGGIVHVLDGSLERGARVAGQIDWPRRADHMQQHTGQHVLSAAFERLFGARTVSFHLGSETATIDLAREVSPSEIGAAERLASGVVWENRPVHVRVVSAEEAAALPLRKEPARTGPLRLVEVEDFDLSACGGTHVPQTGAIGVIAVSASERFKGGSRITFVCGRRALEAHARLRDLVTPILRQLSVGPADLSAALDRMQADLRSQQKQVRELQEELATHRAVQLRASATPAGGARAVFHAQPGWEAPALKTLASAIVAEPGYVAVIVGDGPPTPMVVARSAAVGLDANAVVKSAATALGGRGGGRPELAQGGVNAAPDALLAWMRDELLR